jgi:hypothetical protein
MRRQCIASPEPLWVRPSSCPREWPRLAGVCDEGHCGFWLEPSMKLGDAIQRIAALGFQYEQDSKGTFYFSGHCGSTGAGQRQTSRLSAKVPQKITSPLPALTQSILLLFRHHTLVGPSSQTHGSHRFAHPLQAFRDFRQLFREFRLDQNK